MKSPKKGFTLIELLVVIAIIGVLASIVFVNVNSARLKAKDAGLKGNLSQMMVAAEQTYDTSNSYSVVCTAGASFAAYTAATAQANGGTVSCVNSAAAWCACGRENADTSKYFCVDSTGGKTEAAITCAVDCETTDYVCNGT
jgi:prepilin-type N-terminal cleavage/methylation domain-containing protein